jgi:hypothetical protein
VEVASGADVTGIGVVEAGIWVWVSAAGTIVFVDRATGLVGGATATDKSHARATMMNMERNRKVFFMTKFPFMPPIIATRA